MTTTEHERNRVWPVIPAAAGAAKTKVVDTWKGSAPRRKELRVKAYRGTRRGILYTLKLVFIYIWRGAGWAIRDLHRWVTDYDSAKLRKEHVDNTESKEYQGVNRDRRHNLRARLLVAMVVAGPPLFLALAWTYPTHLAWILAAFAFAWTCKLIPGREFWEFIVAAGVAIFIGNVLPPTLDAIPAPPWWAFAALGAVAAFLLGLYGKPKDKAVLGSQRFDGARVPEKPTKEMVVEALCRCGIPGMTMQQVERVMSETRVIAPGVATSAHGYTMEMELPPGITAEMVVAKRGPFAGAMYRDLGCVWPSGNPEKHPGYLRLFMSHKPMNSGKQPPWPLATVRPIDIFEPIPLFTDEEMCWVNLTLAGTHTAVGGASGFGKSVWLRQLACAIAQDPRVRMVIFDGKRSGDLDHVRKLAHAFHEGAEPDEIVGMLAEMRGLVAEYNARSKFLKTLPADERSPKVTSVLASKYPKQLSPIVVICDEVQEGTEYGIKGNRDDMKIRDEFVGLLTKLSRVGRSAGIFLVLASQKPDAKVIPSAIMGNCSIRVAFKVSEQIHNDQILGTSARSSGIDATMFGQRDRGMAWLKGGDNVDAQVVRSWSEMVDVGLAVELADKAFELRAAGGWLTGAAAGEEPPADDGERLLDDCREVMDEAETERMHIVDLLDRLGLLRPGIYGHLDVAGLTAALRAAGVDVKAQMKIANKNTSGVTRGAIDAADDPPPAGALVAAG